MQAQVNYNERSLKVEETIENFINNIIDKCYKQAKKGSFSSPLYFSQYIDLFEEIAKKENIPNPRQKATNDYNYMVNKLITQYGFFRKTNPYTDDNTDFFRCYVLDYRGNTPEYEVLKKHGVVETSFIPNCCIIDDGNFSLDILTRQDNGYWAKPAKFYMIEWKYLDTIGSDVYKKLLEISLENSKPCIENRKNLPKIMNRLENKIRENQKNGKHQTIILIGSLSDYLQRLIRKELDKKSISYSQRELTSSDAEIIDNFYVKGSFFTEHYIYDNITEPLYDNGREFIKLALKNSNGTDKYVYYHPHVEAMFIEH